MANEIVTGNEPARAAARPPTVEREARLQRAVTVYIVTGLFFLLLPGTFLGVWNLISISSRRELESLSPAWLQAHGHAQIFGWIGTFILGIGFYSLSKMGELPPFAVSRAWIAYALWTPGVFLRWIANVTGWEWRIALPVSAALELGAFFTFFATVSRHQPRTPAGPQAPPTGAQLAEGLPREHRPQQPRRREPWMLVVIGSTLGFLFSLLLNLFAVINLAITGSDPAVPLILDQRLLIVPAWGFLVPAVWGFNARWLPVFLGLRAPRGRRLLSALGLVWFAIASTLTGHAIVSAVFILAAVALAATALHVFEPAERPAKTLGVHPSFPVFVRAAYGWLAVAAGLTLWAALADRSGGIWGASRHALTVGFLATMVFAIGQRILPAFCGTKVLFSKTAMFASLALLNIGCALRVSSEIPAYEGFHLAPAGWRLLPVSGVIELTAVALFAANLLISFFYDRRSAHGSGPASGDLVAISRTLTTRS
jgi:uncharacterized protein involved in response to NO